MAKRGRKPKTERKGYFYEKQEEAVMAYIKSNDQEERNRIFKTILYPAFTKMIESIIRRYKLYVPDEEFDQTFKDTISFLLTKITNFHPETYIYEEVETPTKEMIDSAETRRKKEAEEEEQRRKEAEEAILNRNRNLMRNPRNILKSLVVTIATGTIRNNTLSGITRKSKSTSRHIHIVEPSVRTI